jgi:hypothetical protein
MHSQTHGGNLFPTFELLKELMIEEQLAHDDFTLQELKLALILLKKSGLQTK